MFIRNYYEDFAIGPLEIVSDNKELMFRTDVDEFFMNKMQYYTLRIHPYEHTPDFPDLE